MQIFIDESGTFTGEPGRSSVSAVGALVVPDGKASEIERKYARLRRRLPTDKGEVKGRRLDESQVAAAVEILRRNEAIFEVNVIDMGAHEQPQIDQHKAEQSAGLTRHLPDDAHPELKQAIWDLRHRLERMPNQLYVQSLSTFELIYRTTSYATLYFSQRRPEELGSFRWWVDAKEPGRITDWEAWWHDVLLPWTQSKSLREPMPHFVEGDYSHFHQFDAPLPSHLVERIPEEGRGLGTDAAALMRDFTFSADPVAGLELADILTNAVRRALSGNLGRTGWEGIPKLMIDRGHHYIHVIALADEVPGFEYPYMSVLNAFERGGKRMLAPRFRIRD